MVAILDTPVLDGPLPVVLYVAALAFTAYLAVRSPDRARILSSVVGVLAGAVVAVTVFTVSNVTDAFGGPLQIEVLWWAIAAFSGVGLALANLWRSRWWRKVIASLSIPVFIAAGVVGINALFGLNATVGEVLGIEGVNAVALPLGGTGPDGTMRARPLYETWRAPRTMLSHGSEGYVWIPATTSGFKAREAGLYLPPAAVVPNAPALPLIILMMGFPGHPGPESVGAIMERYQQKHEGLAPIVLVADQIGTRGDPACADSKMYGKAETYVTKDVVNWARAHLHIIQDPKYWAIMGYSNGGGCAIKYGAIMPTTFGNIVDISGEPFPGSEDPAVVTADIFGGSSAAFEASKPMNIMRRAKPGAYDGVNAVFTYGAADPVFGPDQKEVSAVARSVGMTVTLASIPGAAHIGPAFTGGVTAGLDVLCPLWGLSPR